MEVEVDETIQRFWSVCRSRLTMFRAGISNETDPATYPTKLAQLKAGLEEEAHALDSNRRTSPYNMKSRHQEEMDAMASNVLYLAKKWLDAGRPPVPIV